MNGRDSEIIAEGLRQALSKGTDGLALARYYMDELARFLACGCDEYEGFIDETRAFLGRAMAGLDLMHERASLVSMLCRSAVKYLTENGKEITVSDFFEGEELTGGRITYVKNAISDEAYRIFSDVIENASVTYSGSFASACEDVYYGRVAYCILPYETADEGALSGFMRLIRKYELYPHYVCTCGSTRLALLGRAPCAKELTGDTNAFLKLTFYRPEPDTVLKVSAAHTELSLTFVKAESFPISFEDGAYGQELTVCGRAENILPFLLYLELEAPECSDKAIYRRILKNK